MVRLQLMLPLKRNRLRGKIKTRGVFKDELDPDEALVAARGGSRPIFHTSVERRRRKPC